MIIIMTRIKGAPRYGGYFYSKYILANGYSKMVDYSPRGKILFAAKWLKEVREKENEAH